MIKPQVKVETLEMLDPTFEAGVVKTARAQLRNPTTKEFTYTVELYLGITKAATSSQGTVIIGAGQTKAVDFTLPMPGGEGDYPVYLEVRVSGELLTLYQSTENVIIVISPQIEVGPITWV